MTSWQRDRLVQLRPTIAFRPASVMRSQVTFTLNSSAGDLRVVSFGLREPAWTSHPQGFLFCAELLRTRNQIMSAV
jgi:hypothetical protein